MCDNVLLLECCQLCLWLAARSTLKSYKAKKSMIILRLIKSNTKVQKLEHLKWQFPGWFARQTTSTLETLSPLLMKSHKDLINLRVRHRMRKLTACLLTSTHIDISFTQAWSTHENDCRDSVTQGILFSKLWGAEICSQSMKMINFIFVLLK